MTPEQIEEAMRLASMYAQARVVRTSVMKGATFVSLKAANERVKRAEASLRFYLTQFQTVSTAHTTQGEK